MKTRAVFTTLLLLFSTIFSKAVQPRQDTLQVWNDYIRVLKVSMAKRASGDFPFIGICESPELMQRVQRGEVIITDHDPRKVPQGLIHHWIGAIYLPNVSVDQVLTVLSNYERYSDFFSPLIRKSVVIQRDGDNSKVTVVAVQKAFSVTAAVETDNQIQIVRLDRNRIYLMTDATRVQEIANYGQPKERPFPEGKEPGYIWRSFVLERIEEQDGGVYLELEAVSLSRGIPVEVRWLIKPLTDELPRKLMADTLNKTRIAVERSTREQ